MKKLSVDRTTMITAGRFLAGNVIVSLGIVMSIRAELGVSPWNSFHMGLSALTGISVGRMIQLVGIALVVLASLAFRRYPRWGTLANLLLIGTCTDLFLGLPIMAEHWVIRTLLLIGGILAVGVGAGIYIAAHLGEGPRDALMMGLSQRSGWPVARVRSSMEAVVLLLGFVMGGPVGIGTLATVAVGPVVQWSLQFQERLWAPPPAGSTAKCFKEGEQRCINP